MKGFELQHIAKQEKVAYGVLPVLQDVNLQVHHGEWLAVLSPDDGASVLVRALAGLTPVTGGEVVGEVGKIGFVFRDGALFDWLNVEANIAFGLRMQGVHPKAIRRSVARLLELLELGSVRRLKPADLTLEQRMRTAIARALAIAPDLLILDKPFDLLDQPAAAAISELVQKLHQEMDLTIIKTTRSAHEAALLADRVVLLSALPATVEQVVVNHLPHPRNPGSAEFKKFVERLS